MTRDVVRLGQLLLAAAFPASYTGRRGCVGDAPPRSVLGCLGDFYALLRCVRLFDLRRPRRLCRPGPHEPRPE